MKHQVLVIKEPGQWIDLVIPLRFNQVFVSRAGSEVTVHYGMTGSHVIETPGAADAMNLIDAITSRLASGKSVVIKDNRDCIELEEYECTSPPPKPTQMPSPPMIA